LFFYVIEACRVSAQQVWSVHSLCYIFSPLFLRWNCSPRHPSKFNTLLSVIHSAHMLEFQLMPPKWLWLAYLSFSSCYHKDAHFVFENISYNR